ncbi:EndoU domain-containing protein [Parageobacillus thermoglucosidasius]|uniref:EndoU domain-containing protein n=1 Tax=Parageobacillus thermoglucosidasius TaxID=1426 RepID=UPI003B671AA1
MTTIRVKPEELEIVAKHVPDAEDACRRARTSLSWTLPSLAMEIPGIGSAAIRELTDELLHWLRRYEEKLNEAEELLYQTAASIRQADQTLADNMKEFGLELLGWYDLQRVFGEYDPVTGERLSFGDRLFAGGMLLLSVIPPAKGAGIAGKAGIKGAKAAGIAADVSKLVPQMKYVLRYDKMMSVFQAAYLQVVKAPITKTLRYFKKQWNDLLASVSSVQWQPAFAGIGPVSRAGIQETAEEVTSSARFSMSHAGDGVIRKGTGGVAKGTGNDSIFSKGVMKHIFHGEVNKKRNAVGYHHESMMGGKIIEVTDPPNQYGVYRAIVEIEGKGKRVPSTFFPKDWNRVQVVDAIKQVYQNKRLIKDNLYEGTLPNGMRIQMRLDSEGKVKTAYPMY